MDVQTARSRTSEVPIAELDGGVMHKSPMGDNMVESYPCTREQWPIVHRTRNGNSDLQSELLQILSFNSCSSFWASVREYYYVWSYFTFTRSAPSQRKPKFTFSYVQTHRRFNPTTTA
jgi:hypothetical protein